MVLDRGMDSPALAGRDRPVDKTPLVKGLTTTGNGAILNTV